MKCTITIETSELTDLKALIGMIMPTTLPAGLTVEPLLPAEAQTITVTLKDPDTGEKHVITRRKEDTQPPASDTMLTPMGPMPVMKAPAAHKPDPAKKELAPLQTEEKLQPVAPGSKQCEGCHMAFIPKQKNSRYCSDKCSQKAYTATHMSKKNKNIPPVAEEPDNKPETIPPPRTDLKKPLAGLLKKN